MTNPNPLTLAVTNLRRSHTRQQVAEAFIDGSLDDEFEAVAKLLPRISRKRCRRVFDGYEIVAQSNYAKVQILGVWD